MSGILNVLVGLSSSRTLGSTDVLTGGTATSSALFAGAAGDVVDNSTTTFYQASGAADATHYWQYDLGASNAKMIGAWRQYWDNVSSGIETASIKASTAGTFSGEEVTIATVDFNLLSASGYFQVSWSDPGGGATYRYWRIYSATCVNSYNGNRPKIFEFEAYAYT